MMHTTSSFKLFYTPGLAQLELKDSTRPWQEAAADTLKSGHPALLTPIRTRSTLPHSSTLTPNPTLDTCGTPAHQRAGHLMTGKLMQVGPPQTLTLTGR